VRPAGIAPPANGATDDGVPVRLVDDPHRRHVTWESPSWGMNPSALGGSSERAAMPGCGHPGRGRGAGRGVAPRLFDDRGPSATAERPRGAYCPHVRRGRIGSPRRLHGATLSRHLPLRRGDAYLTDS